MSNASLTPSILMRRRLLAKSVPDESKIPGQCSLRGHTAAVCAAADRLLSLRLVPAVSAARLADDQADRLARLVRVAAFLHDLGKASDHFQATVRGDKRRQLVRHEALLPFLVWTDTPLGRWIATALGSPADLPLAVAAGCGHHRKFIASALAGDDDNAPSKLTVLCSHPDFASTLALGAKRFGLEPAPQLPDKVLDGARGKLAYCFSPYQDTFESLTTQASLDDRKLLALAKAIVIAADVAGSAIPGSGEGFDWIESSLTTRASSAELDTIVAARLNRKTLRPFQTSVATSSQPWTFVRAGCGSGKTVAAYAWAARHHGGRQLWFCYPTTGTATEGYRDYLHKAEVEAQLEHSRSEVDFELLDLQADGADGRTTDRLEALRIWGAEVISCTVDTVLGLIQNQRKGLYAFPALIDAALVFDEIHAYDDKLFGSLLRFLEALPGLPVLLMTASLPVSRQQALSELCQRVHGRPLVPIDGPTDLEELARYQRLEGTEDLAFAEVEAALARGEKVLWVSNTVRLTLERAARLSHLAPTVYHSHFRYCDRVERHAEVIARFANEGPALALTTQVAEMSLDLSADLLITDEAPVPALIQRLGRLNRRATPGDPAHRVRPFLVLPFDGLPYSADDLNDGRAWLDSLGTQPLSQAQLVAAWKSTPAPIQTQPSAWLDLGFLTEPRDLREGSTTLTVLREDDAAEVRKQPKRALALALPMGFPPGGPKTLSRYVRVAYLPVIPTTDLSYDPHRGGEWTKQTKP